MSEEIAARTVNPNSAMLWFPQIKAAGLPVPRTIFVPYSHCGILPMFDGEDSQEFTRLVGAVRLACEEIGYPAFIRSDLTSAKHGGPDAYLIRDAENITRPLFRTLEDNEMKLFLERRGPLAIMVRQFLTLPAPFTCFHGLPISMEWRLFADAEKNYCEHPYWPEEALEDYPIDCADWRAELAKMHEPPAEMPNLKRMAIEAARACNGGAWSVDFCQDETGKFWLLDMARARDSYHWPGCPAAKDIT